MEAVILMGIQSSGKSTFFRQRLFDTHVRINLDMLRTRHRENLLFEACLRAGQPFVVDNTNPTRRDRARYIPAARAAGFRTVGYHFDNDLEQCRGRNQRRQDKQAIPPPAIVATRRKFQPPAYDEGFDELYFVRIGPDNAFVVEPIARQAEPGGGQDQ